MATKKQIEANRRNAKKSTGPKTPEGKARSSQNAISHGLCSREVLLREEDPDKFREVWQGVFEDLRPQGEVETYLACRVASGIWRMNRVLRIEAQLFNGSPIRAANPEPTLGEMFKSAGQHGGNPFGKLMRHENAIDRGIQRALKELRTLQAARAATEERVEHGVTRELERRALEQPLPNRGGAGNGRAPAAGKADLQNEPNRAGSLPTPAHPAQRGGGARAGAGEHTPGNSATPGRNGSASTAGAGRSRGTVRGTNVQNEPDRAREPVGAGIDDGAGTAGEALNCAREGAPRRRPLPS